MDGAPGSPLGSGPCMMRMLQYALRDISLFRLDWFSFQLLKFPFPLLTAGHLTGPMIRGVIFVLYSELKKCQKQLQAQ